MKLSEIKKGQMVSFIIQVIFYLQYTPPFRTMERIPYPDPVIGMVMGITNKVTGRYVRPDSFGTPGYITSIKTHPVVVIQIRSHLQKYYAPIYVLPEDVELWEEPHEA